MIVYLYKKECCDELAVQKGDTLNLSYNNDILISSTVNESIIVDWYTPVLFAEDNGIVSSPHLMGMFCNSKDLPTELKNAVYYKDLTPEQFKNFLLTTPVGVINT